MALPREQVNSSQPADLPDSKNTLDFCNSPMRVTPANRPKYYKVNDNFYKEIKVIGEGSYGVIVLVEDNKGEQRIVKIEKSFPDGKYRHGLMWQNESHFYNQKYGLCFFVGDTASELSPRYFLTYYFLGQDLFWINITSSINLFRILDAILVDLEDSIKKRIVHYDLNPTNIRLLTDSKNELFVDKEGNFKAVSIDFGYAKSVGYHPVMVRSDIKHKDYPHLAPELFTDQYETKLEYKQHPERIPTAIIARTLQDAYSVGYLFSTKLLSNPGCKKRILGALLNQLENEVIAKLCEKDLIFRMSIETALSMIKKMRQENADHVRKTILREMKELSSQIEANFPRDIRHWVMLNHHLVLHEEKKQFTESELHDFEEAVDFSFGSKKWQMIQSNVLGHLDKLLAFLIPKNRIHLLKFIRWDQLKKSRTPAELGILFSTLPKTDYQKIIDELIGKDFGWLKEPLHLIPILRNINTESNLTVFINCFVNRLYSENGKETFALIKQTYSEFQDQLIRSLNTMICSTQTQGLFIILRVAPTTKLNDPNLVSVDLRINSSRAKN